MEIKKILSLLFCILVFFSALSFTVSADTGPKPSVRINFENMGNELCYGTLLSEHPSTGPHSVWNGDEEDAQHNQNEIYDWLDTPYNVWYAFVNYSDADGFFFLQDCVWQVNESKELNFTYYPPKRFKILLYYPGSDKFAISGICEKYAFDTYYTVNMQDIDINSNNPSQNTRLNPYKSYHWQEEAFSLIARIIITVAMEMLIAFLFRFKGKNVYILLAAVNITTQIILNVLLNAINFNSGSFYYVFGYINLELLVFIIEAFVYSIVLRRLNYKRKNIRFYIIYSLVANTVSFISGFGISLLLPGIF